MNRKNKASEHNVCTQFSANCIVCGKETDLKNLANRDKIFCSKECVIEYRKNVSKYITANPCSEDEFRIFINSITTKKKNGSHIRVEFIEHKYRYFDAYKESIIAYMISRWPWARNPHESIYCYYNNIDRMPQCLNCGQQAKFHGTKVSYGYDHFCSEHCKQEFANKAINDKHKLKEFIATQYFIDMKQTNRKICDIKKMRDSGFGAIAEYVLMNVPWAKSLTEAMYAFYYDIKIQPTCARCGKSVRFVDVKSGYKKYCSLWCAKNTEPSNKKIINTKEDLINFFKYEYFKNDNVPKNKWSKDASILKIIDNKNILEELYEEYPWTKQSNRILELAYCIKHDIRTQPQCTVCGKPVTFHFTTPKQYNTFCTPLCYGIYTAVSHGVLANNADKNKLTRRIYRFLNINKNKKLKNVTRRWLANQFNVSIFSIEKWCSVFNIKLVDDMPYRSGMEIDMQAYLKSLKVKFIENDRNILEGQELDFFIPEYNLAIEMHGTYWHRCDIIANHRYDGEISKAKKYHAEKYYKCASKNIKLFQIYEHQWKDDVKREIWKSRIAIACHATNKIHKIYARNCVVKEITSGEASKFLKKTHLDGSINSKINIGLFYNEELVAVMTFGKSRFNKGSRFEWEMYRYSCKLYTVIVGGASKLFNYFIKKYFRTNDILISFSNNDYSNGALYINLGFQKAGESESFFYVDRNNKIYNRLQLQKHKLPQILNINKKELETKTANQILKEHSIEPIYTSGQTKWVYKLRLASRG